MSERHGDYTTATPLPDAPHMSSVVLSDQWVRAVNEAQRMFNSGVEQVVLRRDGGRLEIGAVVAFETAWRE